VNVDTGQLATEAEVKAMNEADRKRYEPIPADTKLDTVRQLQKPTLEAKARQAALKSLNRAKNKQARLARRKNR